MQEKQVLLYQLYIVEHLHAGTRPHDAMSTSKYEKINYILYVQHHYMYKISLFKLLKVSSTEQCLVGIGYQIHLWKFPCGVSSWDVVPFLFKITAYNSC